ncbi:tetratricopeptide repeat protein [Ramlibacter monticola]|uniref:Tetratricopeptide repeat protein n=1 Tax=Ramlibacter monticola TaxID=1926872 RepID=A0A936Z019_9BURK|nr:tetratricopeptide repeat protein [Ramlibacter monticola]MBL0392083.1 tetratricopeptide repeat protein [Ramlibacter monticola]
MTATPSSSAAIRLERLAGYLAQDPSNPALLAEACEAAIGCGEHARAEGYIARAERLDLDAAPWLFRRARIAIARRELRQAAELLERVRALAGEHPVPAHDLAHVRLLQGEFEACRALVQPWLDAAPGAQAPAEQVQALQLLWLRAMHRLQSLDEAMAWAMAQEAAGTLQPAARGAASLIAVDLEDFAAARRLADAALAAEPGQLEAQVARGSVALAEGDPALASQLLQGALERNPEDGRIWSGLGLASLQAQDFPLAESRLERATRSMPDHVGTWHALGWARLLQGKRVEALQAFRQALAIDRNFAETHGALGLVLGLMGEAAEALHHLDTADRLDPANVTGRYARALLAGQAGERAALERLARRLLDRPGFFGGKLSDTVLGRAKRPDPGAS